MTRRFHFHEAQLPDSPAPMIGSKPVLSMESRATKRRLRITILIALSLMLLLALVELARAGGPAYVAGVSSFDTGVAGQPLT